MKIAFVGSHGVGKTTLCYDLAGVLKKRLPSVDIVKEVARSCPLPINRETTLAAQSWILHTQIATEIASAAHNHTVICDRSALDNYAYLVAATGGHPVLDELVTYWMTTYDYVFKAPIGSQLAKDGVRDQDQTFQREIDVIVDRLLEEKQITYYALPSRNQSRWMAAILKILDLREPRPTPKSARGADQQMRLPIPVD